MYVLSKHFIWIEKTEKLPKQDQRLVGNIWAQVGLNIKPKCEQIILSCSARCGPARPIVFERLLGKCDLSRRTSVT